MGTLPADRRTCASQLQPGSLRSAPAQPPSRLRPSSTRNLDHMAAAADFEGTWKAIGAENGREFMSSLGLPPAQVEAVMTARPDVIVRRDGAQWCITVDYAQNPRQAKFCLGEAFDYQAANGKTVRATASLQGEGLLKIEAGEMESAEYRLTGNDGVRRLVITMTHGGVSCKMTYQK